MSVGFGMVFLFGLPVLIAQWVGVIALGKAGRTGAWWSMLVGVTTSTLGTFGSVFATYLMAYFMGSGGSNQYMIGLWIVSGLSGLGSLLFMIGFALHGLKSKSLVERILELETVLTAQGEQLARQQSDSAT